VRELPGGLIDINLYLLMMTFRMWILEVACLRGQSLLGLADVGI